MRLIAMALMVVFGAMAQQPKPAVARCKGPDGRPCNAKQVEALSDGVFAAKSKHEALVPVKTVVLAAADGTLKCEQSDGKPCTTEQLDGLKQIGISQQVFINYTTPRAAPPK